MGTEDVVQCVAASLRSRICTFVQTGGRLSIVNIESGKVISAFGVVFDTGGQRCALDGDGQVCFSAAYHRGVAAYHIPDGHILWSRPHIRKVQSIVWDDALKWVVLVRDSASAEVVSPDDGATVGRIPRVRQWYSSPFDPLSLRVSRQLELLEGRTWSSRHRWALDSFASLDACFSRTSVFISESTGPLRAFSLTSGEELWRVTPPRGQHYPAVAFCASRQQVCVARWDYEKGAALWLDSLTTDTGELVASQQMPTSAALGVFASQGECYVGADWSVIDTATGQRRLLHPG